MKIQIEFKPIEPIIQMQAIRTIEDEQATIVITHGGKIVDTRETVQNWHQHCICSAVERAIDLCQYFECDRSSTITIEVRYERYQYQQQKISDQHPNWEYDQSQNPDWETIRSSHKTIEQYTAWTSKGLLH